MAPVGALAEGGDGEERIPRAACSAASFPARPAFTEDVHMATTLDRLTPLGEAAARAAAQAASHDLKRQPTQHHLMLSLFSTDLEQSQKLNTCSDFDSYHDRH